MSCTACHQSKSPFPSYCNRPEYGFILRAMAISGESENASSRPSESQSVMPSPITTIEVVRSIFESALRGGGARELSLGCSMCCCPCCRGGLYSSSSDRDLGGPKKLSRKPPECGRARLVWYC